MKTCSAWWHRALRGKIFPIKLSRVVEPGMIGAFFVDLMNALVIKFFLALPIMQQAAS